MIRKKKIIRMITILLAGSILAGCSRTNDVLNDKVTEESKREDFIPEIIGVYEAEDASFKGNVHIDSNRKGYEGLGYVTGFAEDADTCTFHIEVEEKGFYALVFATAASDYKENNVMVDGASIGTIVSEDDCFSDSVIDRVYLEAGSHEVTVAKYWGWIDLDRLVVQTAEPIADSIYKVSAKLCNENANEETKRLMSFLIDNYGTNFLSGQYSTDGEFGKEFQVVKKTVGKTPAVLGLDFIEYSPSRVENGSTSHATESAIQFWKDGGIVTFCWHWNAPSKYLTGQWYSGFYKEYTNIDLAKIMNGEDQEGYDLLMSDMDVIAKQLQILQEAGVPVIWRPLHEASGGWFWWGNAGADAYKKLYITMYDKFTNEYGLNNLIWLWNGQDADWYPGDEYVDIIGEDIYPGEQVYTSQINKYLEAAMYSKEPKMVVLSENGCVFDPKLAIRDGAMWGFWCTWGSEFVAKNSAIYSYSEQYTQADKLKEFYADEHVLTLDELPNLRTYPVREEK